MIVSKAPRFGYTIKKISVPLSLLFVWDVLVTVFYFKVTLNVRPVELPLSLFGTAIALFIGFGVNASYARWWEARGLWGLMINASRNLAREAIAFCDDDAPAARAGLCREIVRAQIAYVHVLRTALRGEPLPDEAARYLPPVWQDTVADAANRQNMILTNIALLTTEAFKVGMLDTFSRVRIATTLVDIANAQGGMERIKNTPLPSQYRFYPMLFSRLFCIILPFAVVQDLGIYTPAGSTVVSLMFMMAVLIGTDLMDPFANDIYDVPMTSMCRTIEIDLLQMMGEPAPEKEQPVGGVLW